MKFNGVELMKETASLTNALMNSGKRPQEVREQIDDLIQEGLDRGGRLHIYA